MNRKTFRDASDADLLTSFEAGRDQSAFEEIVRRHGPMVKSVMRRALTSREDAEDAFQATFLDLAKAAPRIRFPNSLAAWLHQTAVRTAKSIRRTNIRWHHKRDRLMKDMQGKEIRPSYAKRHPTLQSALEREELRQIIHEELRKLPAQYSTTVILCDLEGLSRQQAARQMATPVSTVCSRLARGRKLLRSQLARRGWELPATAIVTYTRVSENVSRAATREFSDIAALFAAGKLPATATCSQPVLLAKGVLQQMMIRKIIGVVAACVFIGTILPLLSHGERGEAQDAKQDTDCRSRSQ